MIEIRGFADQKIEKTMLLLLEEVGELAKSIRKNATNMRIDNDKINHYDTIESEIADVFIVLSSNLTEIYFNRCGCLNEYSLINSSIEAASI